MAVDWKSTSFLFCLSNPVPNCRENGLCIFPPYMHFQIRLGAGLRRRNLRTSLRLKARDFNHPREGH